MDNGQRGVRLITSFVAIAIAVAVVWVALTTAWMWRYQERVVFQPPAAYPDAPAPARRVEFKASDGHQLLAMSCQRRKPDPLTRVPPES